MLVSLSVPIAAANYDGADEVIRIATSNTGYMEMSATSISTINSEGASTGKYSFTISQYENNELVQTVSSTADGTQLIVVNYCNGVPDTEEIILIADRVTKHEDVSIINESESAIQPLSTQSVDGELVGYITYKPALQTEVQERIQVFSQIVNTDYESYTINGKAADTLSVISGIIVSVIFTFYPPAGVLSVAQELAIAIVSAWGGSVAGGAIGILFSEDVAVYTRYYEVYGYDYKTNRATTPFDGIGRQVLTRESIHYNEFFYEDITPATWKDTSIAYIFYCELFVGSLYNGVESWT